MMALGVEASRTSTDSEMSMLSQRLGESRGP
ncbi:hypothetical protein BN1864_LIB5394:02967 [Pseudomonas sp. 1 R 17]|jgi:hypothetical protein|nr:hypothetical protein BN1864_LIB5394:02967 [Pseudomonas sp. 1 R 17]